MSGNEANVNCLGHSLGFPDSSYSPYAAQPFSAQQTENAASQMNQMAFAANNAATGHYLAAQTSSGISVLSCHPNSGTYGTKVSLKVTSQYDLLAGAMTASSPMFSILFGTQRCTAQIMRGAQDGNGACNYTISADAPPFQSTGCPSLSNVPLTVVVENSTGEEIGRASNAAVFSYHDAHGGGAGGNVGVGGSGDASPPDLGSPKTRSPVQRSSPPHQGLPLHVKSSPTTHHGLSADTATNTYGFPPGVSTAAAVAQVQAQVHAQSDFAASGYSQGSNNMLGTYRNTSFADHYSRAPPVLRSPHGAGWSPFGNHVDSIRSPTTTIPHTTHTITRPSLTSVHSNHGAPQLIRTSTLTTPPNGGAGGSGGYNFALFQPIKATLKINGDLGSMAENWTQEEWENRRRLVMFTKKQSGSMLSTNFKPVSVQDRPTNSICISCIWWEEKQECFVTSVDTIYLLEQLVAAPSRFTVEEKNRIRRNLEGFHPLTVSKAKSESEEFFKVIMAFGNPKPRNIEKDVKVFPWKILDQALKKIISKYSASTSSIIPAVSLGGSYPGLPPTPASATTTDSMTGAGYMNAGQHHGDSAANARSLSGGSTWGPYGSSGRTVSPIIKTDSPGSALRLSTLPAVYDTRASASQTLSSPYGLGGSTHNSPHSHASHAGYNQSAVTPVSQSQRTWDSYAVSDSYSTQNHGQVYGSGPYGDGVQRA